MDILEKLVPPSVKITSQDEIVAKSLKDYLLRHMHLEQKISKNATTEFYTTGTEQDFDTHAPLFYGQQVNSHHVDLG